MYSKLYKSNTYGPEFKNVGPPGEDPCWCGEFPADHGTWALIKCFKCKQLYCVSCMTYEESNALAEYLQGDELEMKYMPPKAWELYQKNNEILRLPNQALISKTYREINEYFTNYIDQLNESSDTLLNEDEMLYRMLVLHKSIQCYLYKNYACQTCIHKAESKQLITQLHEEKTRNEQMRSVIERLKSEIEQLKTTVGEIRRRANV